MKSKGHAESQKHERRIAKRFSGDVTPASGAFWHRKGDVRTVSMLAEHKYTGLDKFVLKKSWLDKIEKEAIQEFLVPVFMFHLVGGDYVVLGDNDFYELFEVEVGSLDADHDVHIWGHKTISIKKSWLDEVEEKSLRSGAQFVIPVHLGGRTYAVVIEGDFEEAIDRWSYGLEERGEL